MLSVDLVFRNCLNEHIDKVNLTLENFAREISEGAVFATLKDIDGKCHLIRTEDVIMMVVEEVNDEQK